MSLRFPNSWILAITVAGSLAGCGHGAHSGQAVAAVPAGNQGVIDSALEPGLNHTLVTTDPRAAEYYDNAAAVNDGKRLFAQYNCSGCHSNGGGGMGPSLMDGEWIYGGRLEQIHQTLVEGRPNGMPSWGGKIPDKQLWQISAYVRSLSLPETLAAQTGPTPSQTPAPVPRSADQDTGWAPPPGTSNDYGTTTLGPNQ
jgi:cytochrome c oxidase cbb3-type subunit III